MLPIRSFIAVAVAGAGLSAAAQGLPCVSSGGPAVSLREAGSLAPFELYAAPGSAAVPVPFAVLDSNGRGLANVDVEVTLPDTPEALMFYAPDGSGGLGPIATPKRFTLRTPAGCLTTLPNIVVGAQPGDYAASVRVSGSSPGLEIPIHVIASPPMLRQPIEPFPPIVVAANDHIRAGYIPAAGAQWSDGRHSGPVAGVPVTFTSVSSSGSSVEFSNGAGSITLATDAFGIVRAPARTRGGPGIVDVRATYADGSSAQTWRYIALEAPAIQFASATPVFEYGSEARLSGSARYVGYPCTLASVAREKLSSRARFTASGVPLEAPSLDFSRGNCAADVYEAPVSVSVAGLPFGTHEVVAEISGHAVLPAAQVSTTVRIDPARSVNGSAARARFRIGSADPGFSGSGGKCGVTSAVVAEGASQGFTLPPPPGVESAYTPLRFTLANCSWRSTTDFPEQPPPGPMTQRVLLEVDDDLPAGTVAFALGPTADEPAPHWYELRTTVVGRLAQFEVTDGARGDDSLQRDGTIASTIVLAVPKYAAVAGSLQDLWWAGPQENGWGMSLTQHGDRLFAALFIYDAQGDPRWLVMSGGAWNESRTTYTGELYSPRGAPLGTSGQGFQAGPPVGTLRLTPATSSSMRLDYTIAGVSGTKNVGRQPFGAFHPFPAPRFDDLWWGGLAQNGWGFAIAQQYRTFFGVLYTYDAKGEPIWFVAPSGEFSRDPFAYEFKIEAKVYRTRGSPWLGTTYDPSRLTVTEVGSLGFRPMDGFEMAGLSGTIAGWRSFSEAVSRQPF